MGIVIRQSIKSTLLNYIGVLLGVFVQFFVVTRFLDPSVIGLTKVFYELALLLAGLALLGTTSSAMRFFPYFRNKENDDNGFLFYLLLVPTAGIFIVGVLYLLLKTPILSYFSAKSPEFADYYYWVPFLMAILVYWLTFETYSNINMRIAVPKGVREIGMRTCMLAAYSAFAFHYIGVSGLILSLTLGYGLCMLTTATYSLRIGSSSFKHDWAFITPELRQKFGRYTGFLVLSAVTSNIISQLDTFMLSGVQGMYSVGIYTIAFYMAEVVNMPTRSITNISQPLAAEAMKENDMHRAQSLYQQVSLHQCLATSILILLVWTNLPSIYAIIPNGDTFQEGMYAVLLLMLSRWVVATLNFGNVLISYSKYYYWTLFITIFLTALTICTNLYFIPRMGVTGASLATLITCLISYGYQQYLVQRKLHTNPFTWSHLKVLAIAALLYGIHLLIPSMTGISPWLDLFVRSGVLCTVAALLMYFLHVSPEIDKLIKKIIKR